MVICKVLKFSGIQLLYPQKQGCLLVPIQLVQIVCEFLLVANVPYVIVCYYCSLLLVLVSSKNLLLFHLLCLGFKCLLQSWVYLPFFCKGPQIRQISHLDNIDFTPNSSLYPLGTVNFQEGIQLFTAFLFTGLCSKCLIWNCSNFSEQSHIGCQCCFSKISLLEVDWAGW